MVWISNGIWNPEAQPFEIRTNGRHFVKNHLKSGQKRPDFEWLIAKARPFENRTIWNPTFKKSGFQMFPDFKWSDFRSPLYSLFICGCPLPSTLVGSYFFYVMAPAGLLFLLFLHHNSQSLLIIFVHWTQLLGILNTWYKLHVMKLYDVITHVCRPIIPFYSEL